MPDLMEHNECEICGKTILIFLTFMRINSLGLFVHSLNTAVLSVEIARAVGLGKKSQRSVYVGGLLHDIGKVNVPKRLLLKEEKLTGQEFDEIKKHVFYGAALLESVNMSPVLRNITLYHHERPDGTGYPEGLLKEDITPEVLVVSAADQVSARIMERPYRPAMRREYAIKNTESFIFEAFDEVGALRAMEALSMIEMDNILRRCNTEDLSQVLSYSNFVS